MAPQEKYAARIAKLLRKAESTTPEEADALIAKAQELMTAYAIDEAMISAARGENEKTREEIVQARITYTGTHQKTLMMIGSSIAQANNCRCVYTKYDWSRPTSTVLTVTGFESDVRRVEMLDASIQLQAASAMAAWWKENKYQYDWMTGNEKMREKREFLNGFESGLRYRLAEANRLGRKEAERMQAERAGTSEDAAKDSVSLVLRSRKDQVDDWYDNKYGHLKAGRSRMSYSGSHNAYAGGNAAGSRANLGGNSVGTRGALTR